MGVERDQEGPETDLSDDVGQRALELATARRRPKGLRQGGPAQAPTTRTYGAISATRWSKLNVRKTQFSASGGRSRSIRTVGIPPIKQGHCYGSKTGSRRLSLPSTPRFARSWTNYLIPTSRVIGAFACRNRPHCDATEVIAENWLLSLTSSQGPDRSPPIRSG
jgi:hypothetical protein